MSDTETNTAIGALVAGFVPKAPKAETKKWTLAMVGNRDRALIHVLVANPKQPGSDAHILFPLQGAQGKPTVTVAQFLAIGAETRGKMGAMGAARARADLLWNLNKGFVKLVGG